MATSRTFCTVISQYQLLRAEEAQPVKFYFAHIIISNSLKNNNLISELLSLLTDISSDATFQGATVASSGLG
jgi:hypothetical protein